MMSLRSWRETILLNQFNMYAIECTDLERRYTEGGKTVSALNGVSLRVKPGEVFGLLGPNGAGKTTLVKILSTLLLPSSGEVLVLGLDVRKEAKRIRSQMGLVLGGDRGLYPHLTARETLLYWAALYGVAPRASSVRTDFLLGLIGLKDVAHRRVETFSRGMKQRLHLARGLVGSPKILFLDEPTIGMDPVAADEFRTVLRGLEAEGCTIFLTTHDMAEAEAVCDVAALIDKGKIIAEGSPISLAKMMAPVNAIEFEWVDGTIVTELTQIAGVRSVSHLGHGHEYRADLLHSEAVGPVIKLLAARGVTHLRTVRPTLRDAYISAIGNRGLAI